MPVIDGIIVGFETRAIQNNFETKQQGRVICKNVDYIGKQPLGDPRTEIWRPIRDDDLDDPAIKAAYDNFKSDTPEALMGTPLDRWPVMDPARIKELNHIGIRTVDELAGLDDSKCQKLGMGYQSLRDQAKGYLAKAGITGSTQALAAENEELKTDIADLQETIKQQAAAIQELQSKIPEPMPEL